MGVFPDRVRRFESGATRDSDDGKLDYEGFFSPRVLERRAQYMHTHRIQSDGQYRSSDNWQKGIPKENYMKSLFRHFWEVWMTHRGVGKKFDLETALCAVMFNAEGYLHELLKEQKPCGPLCGDTVCFECIVPKEADEEKVAFDRWQDSLPEAWNGLSGERSPTPSSTDDGRGIEKGRSTRLASEDR